MKASKSVGHSLLKMPIMDGNEFLRLESEDPQLNAIPVVVVAQEACNRQDYR